MSKRSSSKPTYRPSGRFSFSGMALTLLGGLLVAVAAGLVAFVIRTAISFSIPMVLPAVAGGVVGYFTMRLASGIGRCRNPALAIGTAAVVGAVAWGSSHVYDYLYFQWTAFNEVKSSVPHADIVTFERAVDEYLASETGVGGFVGYMLLKAEGSSVEFGYIGQSGNAISGTGITGFGLILYWLFEVMMSAGLAVIINKDFAREPYCEQCRTWRKYKVPLTGMDSGIEAVVDNLNRGDVAAAREGLVRATEGNIVRLEIEYCPKCHDSKTAQLVVVKDTGPRTWVETTLWAGKLTPDQVTIVVEGA